MTLKPSDRITLPCGILQDGVIYREVVIDRTIAFDTELLIDKKVRNNGARGLTLVLQRIIQEIPGLVELKKDSLSLIDANIVRRMLAADRDFVYMSAKMLTVTDSKFEYPVACPSCDEVVDEEVDMTALDVYDFSGPGELNDGSSLPHFRMPLSLELGLPGADGKRHTDFYWVLPDGRASEKAASIPKAKFLTFMASACLIGLGGERFSVKDLRRMSEDELADIHLFARDNTPGVDLRREMECPECEHAWSADVDLAAFFSSARQKTRTASRSGKSGFRTKRKG